MDKLKEKLEEIACAWDGCTVEALDGESKIDVGAWLRKMFADIQSQAQPDEREAFEKSMNDARFFPAELNFERVRSPSGRDEYVNSHLQSCWHGWQARAALPAKTEQVPTEDEITADMCIELSEELVWAAIRQAIEATRLVANQLIEGPFRNGMESALEEIEIRTGLVATAQPIEPQIASAVPDFCDGHCTWLDHHPDCEKATPQPEAHDKPAEEL